MKPPLLMIIFLVSFINLKANNHNELIEKYENKITNTENPDSIYYYLNLKKEIFKKNGNYSELAKIELQLGKLISRTNTNQALNHAMNAKRYSIQANDSITYTQSFSDIHWLKYTNNNIESSIAYIDTAINLSIKYKLTDLTISAYSSKAQTLSFIGDLLGALNSINKAKKIAIQTNNEKLYMLRASEAKIYFDLERYKESIQIINSLIKHFKEIEDVRNTIRWMNNLSKIYDKCHCVNLETRTKHIYETILYLDKINDPHNQSYTNTHHDSYYKSYTYLHMAHLQIDLANLNEASTYLNKTERLLPFTNDIFLTAWYNELKGWLHYEKKEYKKAVNFTKKAYELYTEIGDLDAQKNNAKKLAHFYSYVPDYKNAFHFMEITHNMIDSLNEKSRIEKIKELEVSAKYDEKNYRDSLRIVTEKKLALLKLEQQIEVDEKNKITLTLALISVSLLGLVLYWALRRKKEQTQILSTKNKQIAESLDEKVILIKEIHHRVKNNFEIVSSLMELQSDEIEDEKALSINKEGQNRIRIMAMIHEKLYSNESGTIDFEDYLSSLIHELSMLYAKNVKTSLETNNISFDLHTAITLGLIVNELVTNSFKYAFSGNNENELKISLKKENNKYFHLKIKDNGPGLFLDTEMKKVKSLGLFLVYRLTRQLQGSVNFENNNGVEFKIVFLNPEEMKNID